MIDGKCRGEFRRFGILCINFCVGKTLGCKGRGRHDRSSSDARLNRGRADHIACHGQRGLVSMTHEKFMSSQDVHEFK